MQNAAPLVQSAHLTPVSSQPVPASSSSCGADFSPRPVEAAERGLKSAPHEEEIAGLPAPETHLAAVDLTPAPICPSLRLAKLRVHVATARFQLEQTRMRVILQQLPDAAAVDAQVRDAVAKAEAGEEIRQIVVVTAPATL